MRGRADLDGSRIALFGSGGTGGGNAIAVAALDPTVRRVISQVPVADGRDWLHRMRSEHDWIAFLARLEADRRRRATDGVGEIVDAKTEIMVATPERRATTVKADVDGRIPSSVSLRSADALLAYRPIDLAPLVSGLMVVAVEDDAVTPTDHAVQLYEAARVPKRLVLQRGTTHYAADKQYSLEVIPLMVQWLTADLGSRTIEVREHDGRSEEVHFVGEAARS